MSKRTIIKEGAIALAAALTFLSGAPAHADGQDRGGGQVEYRNGKPVLRDLVDYDCQWMRGKHFARTLKKLSGILASIAKVHWYLADLLNREGNYLNVCLTSHDLKPVTTRDSHNLFIIDPTKTKRQLAVRLGDDIYIDTKVFDRLSPKVQAYTFIHEVSHSFFCVGYGRSRLSFAGFRGGA